MRSPLFDASSPSRKYDRREHHPRSPNYRHHTTTHEMMDDDNNNQNTPRRLRLFPSSSFATLGQGDSENRSSRFVFLTLLALLAGGTVWAWWGVSTMQQQRQQQQQQQQHGHDDAPADLTEEIRLLRASLENYRPRVTDDPLGWGLEALYDEYLEGHPRRTALARHASSALDYTAHMSLPFRLYGAILGARTADIGPSTDGLLEKALVYERRAQASGCEEHSSINRVMLAMSLLCPGSVLDRRPEDPLIRL
mmetsp:Transcript_17992/g.34048  ORF Transcript_17992/g.34048 Transcript_17992/m.34048 type:complete len:251 (-) Transcript_17992:168-920(-)